MENVMNNGSSVGKTLEVLLVDDDPLFGRIMMAAAEQAGVSLTYSSNPKLLYRHVPLKPFDVVILDYNLGLVTGLQFARFLEERGKSVPTILISAHGQIDECRWPGSIRKSLDKSIGATSILEFALTCVSKT